MNERAQRKLRDLTNRIGARIESVEGFIARDTKTRDEVESPYYQGYYRAEVEGQARAVEFLYEIAVGLTQIIEEAQND